MYFATHFLEIDVLSFHILMFFLFRVLLIISGSDCFNEKLHHHSRCKWTKCKKNKKKQNIKQSKLLFFCTNILKTCCKTCLTTTIGMRCRKYFYCRWNIKFRWNIFFSFFFCGFQISQIYWINVLLCFVVITLTFVVYWH